MSYVAGYWTVDKNMFISACVRSYRENFEVIDGDVIIHVQASFEALIACVSERDKYYIEGICVIRVIYKKDVVWKAL